MRYLFVLLFLVACTSVPYEIGGIEVYFCQVSDCEAVLRDFVSEKEVSCAFYDLELELPSHIDVKLHNRTNGLMHHKFCVTSDRVLTGSMNPTENGIHKNDNVLLVIKSKTLAKAYKREFEELETKKARGTSVDLSGNLVTVKFCPQEDCEETIVREIRKAESSIKFMTFTFTSDPIGDAMLDASDREVVVEGVIEKRQRSKYSELQKLQQWGLNVTEDGNKFTMHHKTFIIDEKIVITGSYNPTLSASTKNDENFLVIHDEELAQMFLSEYNRIWANT